MNWSHINKFTTHEYTNKKNKQKRSNMLPNKQKKYTEVDEWKINTQIDKKQNQFKQTNDLAAH